MIRVERRECRFDGVLFPVLRLRVYPVDALDIPLQIRVKFGGDPNRGDIEFIAACDLHRLLQTLFPL